MGMTACWKLVILTISCSVVSSQFQNFNNFGNPQFGGNSGSFANPPRNTNSQPHSNCRCKPGNQVCDFGFATINTRIINTRPRDRCQKEEILCCPEGEPFPVGPVVPKTVEEECGSRIPNPLLRGNIDKGEANLGDYPWMVALVDDSSGQPAYVGGGVLVSENIVLSAAHLFETINARNLLARVGDYDLSNVPAEEVQPHQAIRVAQIITHPQVNYGSLRNNLAILVLSQPAMIFGNQSPTIRTACLPEKRQTFDGTRCFVSGWGQNALGQFQNIMKEVDLPVIESVACQERLRQTALGLGYRLDESLLCAGGEVGKDTCKGDGGSPLVCNQKGRWIVAGLVAGGIGCGTEAPGLYVNVAHFADFIRPFVLKTAL